MRKIRAYVNPLYGDNKEEDHDIPQDNIQVGLQDRYASMPGSLCPDLHRPICLWHLQSGN